MICWHHRPAKDADPGSRPSPLPSRPAPSSQDAPPPDRFEKRLHTVLAESDPLAQHRLLLSLLDSLPAQEIPNLLHACRLKRLPTSNDCYQLLLAAWAKSQPEAAFTHAAGDEMAQKTVIACWTESDPETALLWLRGQPQDARTGRLLALPIAALILKDPERRNELLEGLSPTVCSNALLGIAPTVLSQGVQAAEQWLNSLAHPAIRNSALNAFVASSAPEEAVFWLTKHQAELEAGASRIEMRSLFQEWSGRQPEAAWTAFEKLPAGTSMHREALQWAVGSSRAIEDPGSVVEIMDRFPAEIDDGVLLSMIRSANWRDSELAANLMLRMENPPIPDQFRTLQTWWTKDPQAAQAWMDRHEMPEALKPHLQLMKLPGSVAPTQYR